MNDIVLSIMVLGALALLGGAWLALKRGDRKRAILMAILAVVIGANVAILSLPAPMGGAEARAASPSGPSRP
ncbi:hypothetical protein [Croceicoccus sp. BE223]|uniref:hypothetical protein n=1 Tax=Croceicoccus sp. BE223 TaxID=2817716 RepID=UPI0028661BAF|nr:hypothetical protein [Croceicoccus sp. BE223]MDR7101858.1 hypothetical protein [Croceicoccus sp. BE223]